MTKQIEPLEFNFHAGDVGHTVVIGSAGAAKSVPEEWLKLLDCGHPGGVVSAAQAPDALDAKIKRAAQRNCAPYYRQFDKRK